MYDFGRCVKSLVVFAFTGGLALSGACRADGIVVHAGQKIAFLGDSITAAGWESPTGYVRLVASALETSGIKIDPLPAGVSGNKSNDMLNRFDADVVSKKPDWLTISCGVNDVWQTNGLPLEVYSANITQIVDKAQAAGIKVVILTATMIGEDQANANNQKLTAYNDFLRGLAKERGLLLADLNADEQAEMNAAIASGWKPNHYLTMDGVHMNPHGNIVMARGILKALGLNETQLAAANTVWMDAPGSCSTNLTYQITVIKEMTLRQYLAVQKATPKDSGNVLELLQSLFNSEFPALLIPGDADGIEKAKKKVLRKIDQDIEQRSK